MIFVFLCLGYFTQHVFALFHLVCYFTLYAIHVATNDLISFFFIAE